MMPLVSCICPTYGRCETDMRLLEECVYWFLRQTQAYRAELVILNDAPGQTLYSDAPNVRIINHPVRYATLGMKYNAMVAVCNGDYILPWEDDDISLPTRVGLTISGLENADYYKPNGAFYQRGANGKLEECSKGNVFHNASGYRKSVWERNPYDESISGPQDATFDLLALQTATPKIDLIYGKPEDYFYVYRWQHMTGPTRNLSGYRNPTQAYRLMPRTKPGLYRIVPRMHRDYQKEAYEYVATQCTTKR